jgi:hypothetical protein
LLVPLILYSRLYYRLSRAVSRRQELEADAAAVAITGAVVTASALRAVHAIGACWEVFRTEVVAPMRRSGRLPDDAFSAFGALLADPEFEPKLARLREALPEQPTRPLDTHPSLADRLGLLSSMPAVPIIHSSRPADSLIAARASLFRRASRALAADGADPLPWRQWLELVAQTRATGPARMLRRAITSLSVTDLQPLAAVLDLLEAGQAGQIAAELSGSVRPPGPPKIAESAESAESGAEEDGEALLLAGMFSLVGQALVAIKAASWQLSLDGECRLVARDITSEELAELLAAAIARPSDVPRLRLHLAALGVNVTAALALGDTEHAPSATARLARPEPRRYLTQTLIVTVLLIVALATIGLATSSKQAAQLGATPQEPGLYTPPGYRAVPSITPGVGSLPITLPSLTPYPHWAPATNTAVAAAIARVGQLPGIQLPRIVPCGREPGTSSKGRGQAVAGRRSRVGRLLSRCELCRR